MVNSAVVVISSEWTRISLIGGFNPAEKNESQWQGLSHILWKIKNVPNHQPDMLFQYHLNCVGNPMSPQCSLQIWLIRLIFGLGMGQTF
jgi:hypothetical protein